VHGLFGLSSTWQLFGRMGHSSVLAVARMLVLSGVTTGDDEATRIQHLQVAMRLLIDQCEGRAPLTPYGDMKLPCAGRDLMDGALGHLLISGGDDTAGCMAWLRNPASGSPASFGGQPWPAIWYTYGERFNETDRAWLFERMNVTAAGAVSNLTNTSTRAAAGTSPSSAMGSQPTLACPRGSGSGALTPAE